MYDPIYDLDKNCRLISIEYECVDGGNSARLNTFFLDLYSMPASANFHLPAPYIDTDAVRSLEAARRVWEMKGEIVGETVSPTCSL